MAARHDVHTIFQDAFVVARRVQTFRGGLRSFRRDHPELSAAEARNVFQAAWDRAQRSRYFEDTHGNRKIDLSQLGCGPSTTHFRITYEVVFEDADGVIRHQHHHVVTEVEDRIGQQRRAGLDELNIQLQDKYYRNHIRGRFTDTVTGIHIVNVGCLTARGHN